MVDNSGENNGNDAMKNHMDDNNWKTKVALSNPRLPLPDRPIAKHVHIPNTYYRYLLTILWRTLTVLRMGELVISVSSIHSIYVTNYRL